MSRRRLLLLLVLLPSMLGLVAFAVVWQRSHATMQTEPSPFVDESAPVSEKFAAPDAGELEAPSVPGAPRSAPAGTQSAPSLPAVSESPQLPEVIGPPLYALAAADLDLEASDAVVRLAQLHDTSSTGTLSNDRGRYTYPAAYSYSSGSRGGFGASGGSSRATSSGAEPEQGAGAVTSVSHGSENGSKGDSQRDNQGDSQSDNVGDNQGGGAAPEVTPPLTDDPGPPRNDETQPAPKSDSPPGDNQTPFDDGNPTTQIPGDETPDAWSPHQPPLKVPEPGTLALLALGLLGCAASQRRR